MKYLSLLMLVLIVACSDTEGVGDPEYKFTGNSNLAGLLNAESGLVSTAEMDANEETMVLDEQSPTVEVQDQKIIKTGDLRFESDDLDATHRKITDLTNSLKGFVATDNSGKNYSENYRNITVRIPSENFQAFIDGVSEGVAYFDRKNISRRDVTEEFVDLEARLKAKRELEKRYLELLQQARNVKEMLEIERELSTIREEIEAKEGRLKYLQDKVSLSTVSIQFYKYTTKTGVTVSYGQKMKKALSGGWDGISVFFLGLLYLWPLFLVLFIIILVLRRVMRRRKKRKNAAQ